eukprot:665657-Pyramimonas_sp.AAC.1
MKQYMRTRIPRLYKKQILTVGCVGTAAAGVARAGGDLLPEPLLSALRGLRIHRRHGGSAGCRLRRPGGPLPGETL